jgi:hypothetical protein
MVFLSWRDEEVKVVVYSEETKEDLVKKTY